MTWSVQDDLDELKASAAKNQRAIDGMAWQMQMVCLREIQDVLKAISVRSQKVRSSRGVQDAEAVEMARELLALRKQAVRLYQELKAVGRESPVPKHIRDSEIARLVELLSAIKSLFVEIKAKCKSADRFGLFFLEVRSGVFLHPVCFRADTRRDGSPERERDDNLVKRRTQSQPKVQLPSGMKKCRRCGSVGRFYKCEKCGSHYCASCFMGFQRMHEKIDSIRFCPKCNGLVRQCGMP